MPVFLVQFMCSPDFSIVHENLKNGRGYTIKSKKVIQCHCYACRSRVSLPPPPILSKILKTSDSAVINLQDKKTLGSSSKSLFTRGLQTHG